MALALMIDGVDSISELVHESLVVNQTNDGLNSTCQFDIRDAGVVQADAWTVQVTRVEDGDVITGHTAFSEPKVEVSVVDGATVYFAGILSRITVQPVGQILIGNRQQPEVQILRCECHDFSALLEESIIDSLEEYVNQTDEAIIDDIFNNYVAGVDFATHVDGGAITIKGMSFENMTVRQMMDQLVARTGYVWYMDYSKKLHYSEAEANAPAWHLSDAPDDVNSFSYLDPVGREKDATNLVNMIFVVASTGGTWFTDEVSRALYGDHKAIIKDERLSITESIALRAAATLDKFKDPEIVYNIKTYQDGLRAGMHIRFVCAYLDVDDTFLINQLGITFPVDGEPVYALTLGGLESSVGGAANRLILDQLYAPPPVAASQLPLASRGWGHDLTFSATDEDTVAWGAGTLTTAAGNTFAIGAGNTDDPGAMAAKTIIYLDAVISLTELQMTTVETAALGANRIMVAVAWPSGVAGVDAGFQVFGATGELATYLNATNVIADCITANEIYGNSLSVMAANIGILTIEAAGEIRAYTNTWDVDADGFRITHDEIAGQLNGVDQINLSAADGKLRAGAGAVVLDATGLKLVGSGATGDSRRVKFEYDDAGTPRVMGQIYADWGGGAANNVTVINARRDAGSPWPADTRVILAAIDAIAGTDVRWYVTSAGAIYSLSCTDFYIYDGARHTIRLTGGDATFMLGDNAGADEFRIRDSDSADRFVVDSDGQVVTPNTIAAGFGDHWKLGDYTATPQTDTGFIDVNINGTGYRLLCRLP